MKIRICKSRKSYCDARIKRKGKPSLCCRYGWCGWACPVNKEELLKEEK